MAFLLCCWEKNIIPTFARVKHAIKSAKTTRILQRTSQAIIREHIQATRYVLHGLNESSFQLNLRMANKMAAKDWDMVSRIIYSRVGKEFQRIQERQKRKFESLLPTQRFQSMGPVSRAVINLSLKQIDPNALAVLGTELNFAMTPKVIPFKEIICGSEVYADTKNRYPPESMGYLKFIIRDVL